MYSVDAEVTALKKEPLCMNRVFFSSWFLIGIIFFVYLLYMVELFHFSNQSKFRRKRGLRNREGH